MYLTGTGYILNFISFYNRFRVNTQQSIEKSAVSLESDMYLVGTGNFLNIISFYNRFRVNTLQCLDSDMYLAGTGTVSSSMLGPVPQNRFRVNSIPDKKVTSLFLFLNLKSSTNKDGVKRFLCGKLN